MSDPVDIECPQCHARAGQSCRGGITGGQVDTHLRRITAMLVPLTDVPEGWSEAPFNPTDLGASRDTRSPKPCCKRLRSPDGVALWCQLPDPHPGEDCKGISAAEQPITNDYGPKRSQTGAKK